MKARQSQHILYNRDDYEQAEHVNRLEFTLKKMVKETSVISQISNLKIEDISMLSLL